MRTNEKERGGTSTRSENQEGDAEYGENVRSEGRLQGRE